MSFRVIAEQLSDAIVITDPKGRITWSNKAFTRMCGYPLNELIGKSPGRVLQGEKTDPRTVKKLHNALKKVQPIKSEILNYRKDGTPYWSSISIAPVKDEKDSLAGFIAIERDATRRHSRLHSLENQVVDIYSVLLHVEADKFKEPLDVEPFDRQLNSG